ncbi:MAG: zinc chelation protein SecC [Spirosoma sp.]|nr:zinc chelation protein SecC [Spirosoma sp.]
MKIADIPSVALIRHRYTMLYEAAETDEAKATLMAEQKIMLDWCDRLEMFDQTFLNRGWILYNDLNVSVVEQTLRLAKAEGVTVAEQYLVDCHSGQFVAAGISTLWGVKEFRPRLHLIKLAYDDYICSRYHACVPVLLMMIDGVVADAGDNLGFFSDKANITAYDSIAGRPNALQALKTIYYKHIGKTDKNRLEMPYRNGILHGRSLGYANQATAAKCWALLFAIRDVLAARQNEAYNRKRNEEEQNKTIDDLQRERQGWIDDLAEVIRMDEFKRAPVVVGVDIPETGEPSDYQPDTPERSVVEFLHHWIAGRYHLMAEHVFLSYGVTAKQMIGRTKMTFANKLAHYFTLTACYDQSSCISDISTTVGISYGDGQPREYQLTFRLMRYHINNKDLVVNPAKEGYWRIAENFASINQIGSLLESLTDDPEYL